MLKLQGHRGKVCAVAFSPDGRRLASVTPREKRVSLWELPGGARTLSPGGTDTVQGIDFAPDGKSVVIAAGRYLHRWDLAANTVEERWFCGANHVHRVAYAPDGSVIAAACMDRYGGDRFRVDLFRPAKPDEKKKFLVGDYGWPYCLAFSPGGRFLAVGSASKRARIWGMQGKAKAVACDCAGNVLALTFSADESLVAVSAGKRLTLYEIATRKPCGELTGHTGYVGALAVSPTGTLLSASDDGTARLWEVPSAKPEGFVDTRRERSCFDWKIGRLNAAAFSRDGTLAAVGGEDGLVVWDVE
jgi:WD40 repeat protein